jgi:5-methylcytosine-specific restriction protein A
MKQALRVCSFPGCAELVVRGMCTRHQRAAEDRRGSSTERGYDRDWRKIRGAFLANHPFCADPFGDHQGVRVRARHVDHVVPLSEGGAHDTRNLQPLCHQCHSRKTALFDGGFGNAKRHR